MIIAGAALGLLRLTGGRSAAQRSAIAHAGLIALLLLPVGEMLLPRLAVEAPIKSPPAASTPFMARTRAPAGVSREFAAANEGVLARSRTAQDTATAPLQWGLILCGLPALALISVTLLALLRLFALRARADVLIEPSWLSAMAHAQRRMGFKTGTALLTSPDLRSPISWGLMRPIILLNDEALRATGEAEAIIAHELAHVARLDWAKLLIGRLATAIHWFNPFAWLLAKEAHQLREEAADDAVLSADIESTGYAQLLVGVARHECKGILLSAHGVAPGHDSLKRRIRRVLDAEAVRGPGARGFGLGVAIGSILFATPLAALSVIVTQPQGASPFRVTTIPPAQTAPVSLAEAVAGAVREATRRSGTIAQLAVSTAVHDARIPDEAEIDRAVEAAQAARDLAHDRVRDARQQLRQAQRDAAEAHKIAEQAGGSVDVSVDDAIQLRAVGVDPGTVRALRRSMPLRELDAHDLAALRAVGATPSYIDQMRAAGYVDASVHELVGARTLGVDANFAQRMQLRFGGYLPLDKLMQLRAIGYDDVPGSKGPTRRTSGQPRSLKLPGWVRNGEPPPGLRMPSSDADPDRG